MLIVCKGGEEIYNVDHIVNIYLSADYCVKAATMTGTRGGILGRYPNSETAHKAMKYLIGQLHKNTPVVQMPAESQLMSTENHTEEHRTDGSVIKRRGGS